MEQLLDSPTQIRDYQAALDVTDRLYRARLVELSLEALSRPLFPGKKAEDGLRPATNDTERELARDQVTGTDDRLIRLAQDREIAQRNLRCARDRFEAAKLVAQLLTASNS